MSFVPILIKLPVGVIVLSTAGFTEKLLRVVTIRKLILIEICMSLMLHSDPQSTSEWIEEVI